MRADAHPLVYGGVTAENNPVANLDLAGKRYAVGYITNAFEGGHKIRKPQGGKGYRPRIKVAAVPGRWSYDAVRRQLAGMSQEDVDALMTLITDGLEGRL